MIEKAQNDKSFYGTKTILFLDEVHRFNSSRQDALLPAVEKGTIILSARPRKPVSLRQRRFDEPLHFVSARAADEGALAYRNAPGVGR
ncbi:hypothetical protein HMSSN036_84440 [Paenibacillus macerans]|nr:hypothetical protein HMSSN036_84440 [Paenibacillus macerans]